MKRFVCFLIVISVFCGIFSACSMIADPTPFPGLDATQETAPVKTDAPTASASEAQPDVTAPTAEFPQNELSSDNVQQQLRLILSCADAWRYQPTATEICCYCITDLDQNGRLEILMSCMSNDGYLSTTRCMEVNESMNALNNCITSELTADLQSMSEVTCYTDGRVIYYAASDLVETIWAEANMTQLALKLENGRLTQETVACVTNATTSSAADIESYYTDAEGRPISRAEFDAAYDTHFAGWQKATYGLGWIGGNYSIPSMEELADSYEAFVKLP